MQNDAGEYVDMYIPRKCSASNKLISAKDHAAIQLNVAELDNGRVSNKNKVYAISGYIRRMGEADDALNQLFQKDGLLDAPEMKALDEDVLKFLAAATHLGPTNMDYQMSPYIFKRREDGVHIMDLRMVWQKIHIAARIIAAIEEPSDVCVISSRLQGQRAVLKFSHFVGATAVAGRFTPGTFTNHTQKSFSEPRLLVVTDPRSDHQAIVEASYVNVPVIALCDTDSPLRFVDVVIPCNTKSENSLGLIWWMLAREVLRLRGVISRELQWDVMPDLFFYRNPEEMAKQEQAAEEQVQAVVVEEHVAPVVPDFVEAPVVNDAWAGETEATDDWAAPKENEWVTA